MATKSNMGIRHRQLRTGVLAFVGAAVCVLLAGSSGYLPLPSSFVFPLILLLVAAPTVFWWAWIDEWIAAGWRGQSKSQPQSQPESSAGDDSGRAPRLAKAARVLFGAYAVVMLLPIVILLARRREYDSLPVPAIMWLMVWHLSLMLAGVVGLFTWVPWLIGQRLRMMPLVFARSESEDGPTESPSSVQMSRRAILTGALAGVPILLSGGAVAAGMGQQGRFTIRRIDMRLAGLPSRLRGLTVTHVSDFHVGRLFRPEHLGRVVDTVNELDSDLIAITGDIVDHSADFLPAACDAFAEMRSRYGRFVVAGNHDLIDSPRQAMEYLAGREPNFLADACATLDIGGERLRIAGLFWSRSDRERFGLPGHYDRVEKLLPPVKTAGTDAAANPFTIALAHHPHAFDALADAGVNVTLSGHTHGGQLMATPPGSDYPIGGGSLLFRYIWGEYRRGDSAMYVNSGVGNWFPVRINAPAEIVQIRLV